MERLNTVSGLVEKRRELEARLEAARAEIKTIVMGLDALDITLRLFGAPDITARPMRLPPAHPAAKGEFQRAVLDLFRETGGPISSRMVADRFCERRGLTVDEITYKSIRYRATSTLGSLRKRGILRCMGEKGPAARWVIVDGFDLDRSRYWSTDMVER